MAHGGRGHLREVNPGLLRCGRVGVRFDELGRDQPMILSIGYMKNGALISKNNMKVKTKKIEKRWRNKYGNVPCSVELRNNSLPRKW
jgi:hypothetical protein